jgi:hypothetical protein
MTATIFSAEVAGYDTVALDPYGLQAWPEDHQILWSMPNGNSGKLTVRQALRFAKQAATQGEPETARILARAIARGWRYRWCSVCLTGGHALQTI